MVTGKTHIMNIFLSASILCLLRLTTPFTIHPACAETMPTIEQKEKIIYLSPKGNYTQIRLAPRPVPEDSGLSYPSCSPSRVGELFLDEADSLVYACEPKEYNTSSQTITSCQWTPFNSVWSRQQFSQTLTPTDHQVNTPYEKTFLNIYPVNSFSDSGYLTIGHDEPGLKLSVIGREIFLNTPEIESEHHIYYSLESGGAINEYRTFSNSLDTSVTLTTSYAGRKFIWMPERETFVAGRVGPSGTSEEDFFDNDHMPAFSARMGRNQRYFSALDEGPFTPSYNYSFTLSGANNLGRFVVGGQNNDATGCHTAFLFGGENNYDGACSSLIIGGKDNSTYSQNAPFVLGGQSNVSCSGSGVLGGFTNKIFNSSDIYSFIANGTDNTIGYADDPNDDPDQFPDSDYTTNDKALRSAIINGNDNRILGDTTLGQTYHALIATGDSNSIHPGGDFSVIANGDHNTITGTTDSAAGAYQLILNGGDGSDSNTTGNTIQNLSSTSDSPKPSTILNGRDNIILEASAQESASNTIINGQNALILAGIAGYGKNSYTTIGSGYAIMLGNSYTWIPSGISSAPSQMIGNDQSFSLGPGTISSDNTFYTPRMWINTTGPISTPSDEIPATDQRLVVLDESFGITPSAGEKATIIETDGTVTFFHLSAGTWIKDYQYPPSSDRRLKKDIHPLSNALSTLKKLRGMSFEWKKGIKNIYRPGRHLGFIAQELREIFPQWVYEGSDSFLNLRAQRQPAALITAAVQELNTRFQKHREAQLDKIKKMTHNLNTLLAQQTQKIADLDKAIHQNTQRIETLSANKEVLP